MASSSSITLLCVICCSRARGAVAWGPEDVRVAIGAGYRESRQVVAHQPGDHFHTGKYLCL
jgi:hypothetical protein